MSYQISYTMKGSVYHKKPNRMKSGIFWAGIILLVGIMLRISFPVQIQNAVRQFMPWTQEEVVQVYNRMHRELRAGESFSDAFAVFCRDVIQYGNP